MRPLGHSVRVIGLFGVAWALLLALGVRSAFRRPTDERATRRQLNRWFLGLGVVVIATGVGALVSYLAVRSLFEEDGTRQVQGWVIREEGGPLGVWNELTVQYQVGSEVYTRTIPVKGNGFSVTQLKPYYYHRGDRVALLALRNRPGSVRTATRWTPALYDWAPAFAAAVGTSLLLLALRPSMLRKARAAHGPGSDPIAT